MENQHGRKVFLFNHLRVETIRCLEEYIKPKNDGLAELKDRFRGFLPKKVVQTVGNVKGLLEALEKHGIIGLGNVEYIKMLANNINSKELLDIVKAYEFDCSGWVYRKTCNAADTASGGVKTAALYVKAVLSVKGVQLAIGALFLQLMCKNDLQTLQAILPFRDFLSKIISGSVIFVLNISSISSLKWLWKSYKEGSLTINLKKALNEIKELKEESNGEEIDVEITIDEEEYREVYWNIIQGKANESKQNSTKDAKRKRRHSMCRSRDVPQDIGEAMDVTQIRLGRHVKELDLVIDNFNSIEEKQRLIEIKRELSEMKISVLGSSLAVSAEESLVHSKMREDQRLLLEQRLPHFQDEVIATDLLDNLPCLTYQQKDQIGYDEKNYLPSKAVRTLVDELKEHKEGFHQFVQALHNAHLGHVALLLEENFADIPIIIRINRHRERKTDLERAIASKFSNSSSVEAKKLRQDFEKVLPKRTYFVHTKLVADTSPKHQEDGTTAAKDLPQERRNSLAVICRLSELGPLDKLWEIQKYGRLYEIFKQVLMPEEKESIEAVVLPHDYESSKKTLQGVKVHSRPLLSTSEVSEIVQIGSTFKDWLNKDGYQNWLKVGIALELIRKELQPYFEIEAKAFYEKLKGTLRGRHPCSCTHTPRRQLNPHHDMSICFWARELEKHHIEGRPTWSQSDASLWNDPNVGHWEVAKLFTSNYQANTKRVVGAQDINILDLLSILSMCNHFYITKFKEIRNVGIMWSHAVGQVMDQITTNAAFQATKRFLHEFEILKRKLHASEQALTEVDVLESEPLVVLKTEDQ